ncbi:MAG: InlB B-repeat-containing protein [Lachnospiraceae bacterium]|nr:InlB B-repeat-containing protein [Lachnospiraceae bacterium]
MKRNSVFRTIITLLLIVSMTAGMAASLGKKANAASTITVTWLGNGGKNSSGQTSHKTYYYGSSVTLKPSSTLYTRSGYTLTGFTVNGKTYSVGTSFTITKDTTITCNWKQLQCTVKIWDKAISPTGAGKTTPKVKVGVQTGTTLSKALSAAKISATAAKGYTRTWYNVNGGTVISTSRVITSDISIYYVDTPNTCKATFIYGNQSKTVTLTTGKTIESKITRLDFTTTPTANLVGWKKDNDPLGDVIYTPGNKCIIESSSSQTYRAVFLPFTKNTKQDIKVVMSREELIALQNQIAEDHNKLREKYATKFANHRVLTRGSIGASVVSMMVGGIPGIVIGGISIIACIYAEATDDLSLIEKQLNLYETQYDNIKRALNENNARYKVSFTAKTNSFCVTTKCDHVDYYFNCVLGGI